MHFFLVNKNKVLQYFGSNNDVMVIACYILFSVTQIAIFLSIYSIFKIRTQIRNHIYNKQFSVINQGIHTFAIFANKFLSQFCISVIAFLINKLLGFSFTGNMKYQNIKFVDLDSIKSAEINESIYILLSFMIFCEFELLIISSLQTFFGQDKSLNNKTLWSTKSWYAEIYIIFIQIVTQIFFAFGSEVIFCLNE